ncbi:MAG: beta-propeller fold lactonase family protein [Candidatus Korobacteraceae bacterium]
MSGQGAEKSSESPLFAYVGCRTTKERGARGEGINVYRVDRPSGAWTHLQLVKDLVNPSFLAFDRKYDFLYCVHGDCSEASAFRVDPRTGTLAFLDRQSTSGKNPVVLRKNLVWPRIDSGF